VLHRRPQAATPLILATVWLLAAAPVAHAAWTTPQTVSAPGGFARLRALASGPAGELVSFARALPARSGVAARERVYDALAAPGAPFGPQRALPASYTSGPMVALGGGRVAQLLLRPHGLNESTASVVLGAANGRFGVPHRVPGPRVFGGRAALAGNARGELLVTWIAAGSHGVHRVVWASRAARPARFGKAQIVSSRAQAEQVDAAMGPQGDAVVAFPDKWGHMLARVRRRRAGRWGPLQRIGLAAGGTENDVTPFVGRGGRIVVAWYETQLCSGGCESPGFTRVAVQPSGRSRFAGEQVLGRDPTGLAGSFGGVRPGPVVVAAGRAAPIVVFLRRGGARATPTSPSTITSVVEVSRPRGDRFGAPQAISPAGEQAIDPAAAAGPTSVLVTWVRADDGFEGTVFATVGSSARYAFAPPEQVSPSEQADGELAVSASGAARGTSAPWTVAWTSRGPDFSSSAVRIARRVP
jgi:hypothetical protein